MHFKLTSAIQVPPEQKYYLEWVTPDGATMSWKYTTGRANGGGKIYGCNGTADTTKDGIFKTFY